MFIKDLQGHLVNLSLVEKIGTDKDIVFVRYASSDRLRILYAGTKQQCQAYITELEKELAAFGKLIRVEVD